MISAVILTKNEEKMITACLNSLYRVADEIIIIDNGSTDKTIEMAIQYNAKIISSLEPSFAKRRDLGAQHSQHDWILYIDADERITKELSEEILKITSSQNADTNDAYIINRKDYYFGDPRPLFSPMHRLFKRSSLQGWHGDLHETPNVSGTIGHLSQFFIHLTHVDINSMLTNTLNWSDHEAQLRYKSNHPPIVWWRLLRVSFTGFWNSFVTQKGYQCGTAGWVEALYQGCSMYITYAKLWEIQNKERINSNYKKLDEQFLPK